MEFVDVPLLDHGKVNICGGLFPPLLFPAGCSEYIRLYWCFWSIQNTVCAMTTTSPSDLWRFNPQPIFPLPLLDSPNLPAMPPWWRMMSFLSPVGQIILRIAQGNPKTNHSECEHGLLLVKTCRMLSVLCNFWDWHVNIHQIANAWISCIAQGTRLPINSHFSWLPWFSATYIAPSCGLSNYYPTTVLRRCFDCQELSSHSFLLLVLLVMTVGCRSWFRLEVH